MPLVTSFPALAAANALFGLFVSANYALTTVILIELVGFDRLTNAVGIVSFAQGIANLVGPPLAGNAPISHLLPPPPKVMGRHQTSSVIWPQGT